MFYTARNGCSFALSLYICTVQCTHGGNSILTRTLGQLSIFRSICFVFVAKLNSCNVPSSVPENADRMPDDFGSRIFFVSISGEPLKKLLISGTFPPNRLNHLNPFPTSVEDPYPIISELIDWIRIPSKTRFRLLKTVSKNDLTNFRIKKKLLKICMIQIRVRSQDQVRKKINLCPQHLQNLVS